MLFLWVFISGLHAARESADFHPMTLRARPPFILFIVFTGDELFIVQWTRSEVNLLFLQEEVSPGLVPVNILRLPQHILSHRSWGGLVYFRGV